jgi:hypothetical protein
MARVRRQRLIAGRRWQLALSLLVLAVVAFIVDFMVAPWEHDYRKQGVAVILAQLDGLPGMNNSHPSDLSAISGDRILVSATYARADHCDLIFAHYRQLLADKGWTFAGHDTSGSEWIENYATISQGYPLALGVDCDSARDYYTVDTHVPFPYEFALVGWLFKPR